MGSSHNLEMSSLSTNKAKKENRLPPKNKKAKKAQERPKKGRQKAKRGLMF
jgi:hypothetical protein